MNERPRTRKPIKRVGVIGGKFGAIHAAKVIKLSEVADVQLVGMLTTNGQSGAEAAARVYNMTGVRPKVFTDREVFLEETNPMGVTIASSPSTHADMAAYFLRNGVHTLIEKPMVKDEEEFSQLEKAAKEGYADFATQLQVPFYHGNFKDLLGKSPESASLIGYDLLNTGTRTGRELVDDLLPHLLSLGARYWGLPENVEVIDDKVNENSAVVSIAYDGETGRGTLLFKATQIPNLPKEDNSAVYLFDSVELVRHVETEPYREILSRNGGHKVEMDDALKLSIEYWTTHDSPFKKEASRAIVMAQQKIISSLK